MLELNEINADLPIFFLDVGTLTCQFFFIDVGSRLASFPLQINLPVLLFRCWYSDLPVFLQFLDVGTQTCQFSFLDVGTRIFFQISPKRWDLDGKIDVLGQKKNLQISLNRCQNRYFGVKIDILDVKWPNRRKYLKQMDCGTSVML